MHPHKKKISGGCNEYVSQLANEPKNTLKEKLYLYHGLPMFPEVSK
jgi:hypothetical protein